MLISNLASLIKNTADEKIATNAKPTNKYRYQANRTFIIGRIRKLFPKILVGIYDISVIDLFSMIPSSVNHNYNLIAGINVHA